MEEWREHAKCTGLDPDYFYPAGIGHDELNKDAMEADTAQFCHGCPSENACGEYAIVNRLDDGVWGGMTSKRRKNIRKRRLAAILEESRASA